MVNFKAYPRTMWLFSLSMVISAIGEAFLWPLTMLYMVQVFDKQPTLAAIVLLLQYSGGLLGNVVGGILFDRWSGKKTILSAVICSIMILIIMGLTTHFVLYVVLLVLLGFCNGMFWPGTRALAITIWPEGGRRAINMVYVANNLGVAIGATLGGLIATVSFKWAFFGNSFTYVCFLVVFLLMMKQHHLNQAQVKQTVAPNTEEAVIPTRLSLSTRFSLGMLVTGFALIVITYIQWQTTVPTYISSLGISLSSYSILWAVNGLVIVLCQPFLSWFIREYSLQLQGQIVVGAFFFTASMLIISLTTSYTGFVIGMIIVTIGEMLVWPGVPAIAAELAPAGKQGLFQGLATSGQSAGRMVGPLIGSYFYVHVSAQGMLTFMVILALASIGFFLSYNRIGQLAAKRPHSISKTSSSS